MEVREVGRWRCEKCDKTCVAAGHRDRSITRIGTIMGVACPWGCGAWVNRGFRFVKSSEVVLYSGEDWDRLSFSGTATIQLKPSPTCNSETTGM